MSNVQFTYKELDNSIYWAIRKTVEDLQYSPPINSYQPENVVNRAAFRAAAGALETLTGNKFIRVLGVGFSKKRGAKTANTIYINRNTGVEGDVAHNNDVYQANVGNTFSKLRVQESTKTVGYEVRFITEFVEYERIMRDIVLNTLTSGRKYLKLLIDTNYTEDPERYYLLEFTGDVKLEGDTDFIEIVYSFNIVDVWIATNDNVLNNNVPQLIRVEGVGNTEPNQNDDIDLTN